MAKIAARVPYSRRSVPTEYARNFLNQELANLARGIPPQLLVTKTSDYTVTSGDFTVLVDASAAPVAITLPQPDQAEHLYVTVKKIDASAHAVTLVGTIDGAVNPTLATQYKSKTVQSDGFTYYTLAAV